MILGKYNQAKTITFDLFEIDGIDLRIDATFASGDVKIMKDEGAEANTTNLPTDEGTGYSLVLTATEMSAARIRIYFIDQTATKVWLDASIGVETYGNASAEHAFDLDTAAATMRGTDNAALATALATAQNDLDIITDTDGVILGAAGVDLVIDEVIDSSTHTTTNSLGWRLKRLSDITFQGGSVNDASATTTSFVTDLTETDTDFYKGQLCVFTSGVLAGQARVVDAYNGTTKAFTFLDAATQAPGNTDTFIMWITHLHSAEEIADTVWDEATSGHTTAGTTAKALTDVLADTNELQTNQGNWLTATGFATETKQDIIDTVVDGIQTDLDNTTDGLGALKLLIDAVKVDTAAILVDTNEIQGDWTNGGRLDLILDAILDDTGTSGVVLTAAERNSIADAMLDRDMSTGADSGSTTVRTVRQALRANRNKVSISGGTMTITKEDDSTASWTAAITTTAGDPISAIDPA